MKTIYGLSPYFKNIGPHECEDETADKLIKMGRASLDKPKKMPWDPEIKDIEPDKETKTDPKAPYRRKK